MALEVRHNRAKHTHENIQFRRIVRNLIIIFDQKGWEGLLIGNPFNQDYSRFRADAILLYNHGLIIIDFKDYQGKINLPHGDRDFRFAKWYNETETDQRRILIQAGSQFINPFAQLNVYREVMKEIVSSSILLNNVIDVSQICSINIFSGPIELSRETPRNILYYKIIEESNLHEFLYDYSSRNTYSNIVANALISVFPAEKWEQHTETSVPVEEEKRTIRVDKDIENEIRSFLQEENSGVLILKSMNRDYRDDWANFILNEATSYGIPQTEVWAHSSRISNKIQERTKINSHSLYSAIYGGASEVSNEVEAESTDAEIIIESEESHREVVPLKPSGSLEDSALIILHEAHLVTKSLYQTELLRFGTGRLLEDFLKFLDLEGTKRKLVCIGDPYSLSFGKVEESALSQVTVNEFFSGNVKCLAKKHNIDSESGKTALIRDISKSIDEGIFNSLKYKWNDEFMKIGDSDRDQLLKQWNSAEFTSDPDKVVMVYSNKQANQINLWVKKNCLSKSNELESGDLLLVHNNINIPDETGFGHPSKIFNGMYLIVIAKGDVLDMPIKIKQSVRPVMLSFTRLKVKCLGLPNNQETDVLLMNNSFYNDNELSKNEQIAFKVLIFQKLQQERLSNPFEKSKEYQRMQEDPEYIGLVEEEKQLKEQHEHGQQVKGKLEKKGVQVRKIERKYKKKYDDTLLLKLRNTDPHINAIRASYGWAATVHKAVGSCFDELLLDADWGGGFDNEGYFRWLYSAMSSAESRVYISNPVEINPLMKCVFEDTSQVGIQGLRENRRTELDFSDRQIPDRYAQKLEAGLDTNVRGCISELSMLLEQKGYLLERTGKNGNYLSKAIYSTPESVDTQLVIAINNNNAGVITSIRIEKSGGANESAVNDCISSVKSKENRNMTNGTADWPADLRKSTYDLWKEKCQEEGFGLKLTESHSYQDVFFACKDGAGSIRFRVYYGKDGFFSKISIIEKTDACLGQKFRKILLDGE